MQGATAYIANVGDSRTYLFRDGQLKLITQDHSLVGSMVEAGIIKQEEIYTHPQRNIIYRSLGNQQKLKVDLFQKRLQRGDRLLLCSDGLWEMVRDREMAKIMQNAPNSQIACQQLIKAANANGGKDNIGVVIVSLA